MKRLFDIVIAAAGLLLCGPLLVVIGVLVWIRDGHTPLYLGTRVGLDGRHFRMAKFRSMVTGADRSGVDSTASDDPRITGIGHILRSTKLDELPELWNVLVGDMSLVGPRPNVIREVARYTAEEQRLLGVRPGVTDLASIVFADEGEILRGSSDPDLLYNQIIRPWKSRLGLLYVESRRSLLTDMEIIGLTLLSAVNRPGALRRVAQLVKRLGGDDTIVAVAGRVTPPLAAPPPGGTGIAGKRPAATVSAN